MLAAILTACGGGGGSGGSSGPTDNPGPMTPEFGASGLRAYPSVSGTGVELRWTNPAANISQFSLATQLLPAGGGTPVSTASELITANVSTANEIGHDGRSAVISSNSVAVGSISGRNAVGGLIGNGQGVIVASNSVAVGNISGNDDVGGLFGQVSDATQINASYVVANSLRATGTSVDGLIGNSNTTSGYTVIASYWRDITGLFSGSPHNPGANAGAAVSADDLRRPTNTDDLSTVSNGIYSSWGNAWCNPVSGEFTEVEAEAMAGGYANNRAWDFGTATEYPALTCVPFTPYQQRELARRALAGESFTPFPPREDPAS